MNNLQRPKPNRRQVLKGAGVIGGLVGLLLGEAFSAGRPFPTAPPTRPPAVQPGQDPSLETLAGAAVSGGPGKDGIPLHRPTKVRPGTGG